MIIERDDTSEFVLIQLKCSFNLVILTVSLVIANALKSNVRL